MIPSPWVAVVLALAAYRLTRLAGWDDFPLAVKVRAWATGEYWVPADGPDVPEKAEGTGRVDAAELGLPGKQPSSEAGWVRPAYRRPTVSHLVRCPYCVGFYLSVAVYVLWLEWPPMMYGMAPFALSGAVGLIAKNLDA